MATDRASVGPAKRSELRRCARSRHFRRSPTAPSVSWKAATRRTFWYCQHTRARIALLYARHRQSAYIGREAEWARQEADFFRAQREGRVRCGTDVFGK